MACLGQGCHYQFLVPQAHTSATPVSEPASMIVQPSVAEDLAQTKPATRTRSCFRLARPIMAVAVVVTRLLKAPALARDDDLRSRSVRGTAGVMRSRLNRSGESPRPARSRPTRLSTASRLWRLVIA
jgi:hypothetical protein